MNFKKLKDLWKNEILLTVTPEYFEFQSSTGTRRIATYFIISTDEKQIILSAGEDYAGPISARRMSVFETKPNKSEPTYDALQQFIRHGVATVTNGLQAAIRPQIVISGVDSLKHELNGNPREVLQKAALNAQAIKVEFR